MTNELNTRINQIAAAAVTSLAGNDTIATPAGDDLRSKQRHMLVIKRAADAAELAVPKGVEFHGQRKRFAALASAALLAGNALVEFHRHGSVSDFSLERIDQALAAYARLSA